jgi:mannosyltransferase
MVTALAASASYLLVRALQALASGATAERWLAGYSACLAALGCLHPLALLLVVAHAVPVGRAWLARPAGLAAGRLAAGWLAAVAVALTLASPVILLVDMQRAPLTWARYPLAGSVMSLARLIGPGRMPATVGVVMLGAVAVIAASRRLRTAWPGDLLALCLPWLILPPAVLIGASVIRPVYVFRYVLFCAPAVALLMGAGLAALGWAAGAASLAIIAVLGMQGQLYARSPGGHGDNIRGADRIVATNMRPGDVLLFRSFGEPVIAAYPYGLSQLKNIDLGRSAVRSGTLGGTRAQPQTVRLRLGSASRVWLVQLDSLGGRIPVPPPGLSYGAFIRVKTWPVKGMRLSLYVRRSPSPSRPQGAART